MTRLALKKRQHLDKLERRRLRSRVKHAMRALYRFGRACWLVATWPLRATAAELGIKDPLQTAAMMVREQFPEVEWDVTWPAEARWEMRRVVALVKRQTRQVPIEEARPARPGSFFTASLSVRYVVIRGEAYADRKDFSRWFFDAEPFVVIIDYLRMMAQRVTRCADEAERQQLEVAAR